MLPVCQFPGQAQQLIITVIIDRRGLVVVRLPADRTSAADKFLCFAEITAIAALGTGCTLTAVPRSTQPSILRGTVNEYQPYGWVIIQMAMGECSAYSSLYRCRWTQRSSLQPWAYVLAAIWRWPTFTQTTQSQARSQDCKFGADSVFGGADIFRILLYCYSLLTMSTVSVTKHTNIVVIK